MSEITRAESTMTRGRILFERCKIVCYGVLLPATGWLAYRFQAPDGGRMVVLPLIVLCVLLAVEYVAHSRLRYHWLMFLLPVVVCSMVIRLVLWL